MNNILRRVFHVVAALSYGWLALIFVSLSMLADQAGYANFVTVFDIGVIGSLFLAGVSVSSAVFIFWKESLFVTKANTAFFSIATLVYIWLLIDSGAGLQFDWSLIATVLIALFGFFTLNNPLVPKVKE
jgi:hypothetical protein